MGLVELESINSQICEQKVSGPTDSAGIMIFRKIKNKQHCTMRLGDPLPLI